MRSFDNESSKEFTLENVTITEEDIPRISKAIAEDSLKEIKFKDCILSPATCRILLNSLPKDIIYSIDNEGAIYIDQEEFILGRVKDATNIINELAEIAKNKNFIALNNIEISKATLEKLLTNTTAKTLQFSFTTFKAELQEAFKENLPIEHLIIYDRRNLQTSHIEALANILTHLPQLQSLSLRECEIPNSAKIGKFIGNHAQLKELDLSNVKATPIILMQILQNLPTNLKKLSLNNCRLNHECIIALKRAIERNPNLTEISLENVKFGQKSKESKETLIEILQSNTQIKITLNTLDNKDALLNTLVDRNNNLNVYADKEAELINHIDFCKQFISISKIIFGFADEKRTQEKTQEFKDTFNRAILIIESLKEKKYPEIENYYAKINKIFKRYVELILDTIEKDLIPIDSTKPLFLDFLDSLKLQQKIFPYIGKNISTAYEAYIKNLIKYALKNSNIETIQTALDFLIKLENRQAAPATLANEVYSAYKKVYIANIENLLNLYKTSPKSEIALEALKLFREIKTSQYLAKNGFQPTEIKNLLEEIYLINVTEALKNGSDDSLLEQEAQKLDLACAAEISSKIADNKSFTKYLNMILKENERVGVSKKLMEDVTLPKLDEALRNGVLLADKLIITCCTIYISLLLRNVNSATLEAARKIFQETLQWINEFADKYLLAYKNDLLHFCHDKIYAYYKPHISDLLKNINSISPEAARKVFQETLQLINEVADKYLLTDKDNLSHLCHKAICEYTTIYIEKLDTKLGNLVEINDLNLTDVLTIINCLDLIPVGAKSYEVSLQQKFEILKLLFVDLKNRVTVLAEKYNLGFLKKDLNNLEKSDENTLKSDNIYNNIHNLKDLIDKSFSNNKKTMFSGVFKKTLLKQFEDLKAKIDPLVKPARKLKIEQANLEIEKENLAEQHKNNNAPKDQKNSRISSSTAKMFDDFGVKNISAMPETNSKPKRKVTFGPDQFSHNPQKLENDQNEATEEETSPSLSSA